jgi:hypothetical protein
LFVDAHLALATVDQALNRSIDLSVSGCAVTIEIDRARRARMVRRPAVRGESASAVQSGSAVRASCATCMTSVSRSDAGLTRSTPTRCTRLRCVTAADVESARKALRNLFAMQHTGIEKVMSTMGIHEVDGYGRALRLDQVFRRRSAGLFGIKNYCGSESGRADVWREARSGDA